MKKLSALLICISTFLFITSCSQSENNHATASENTTKNTALIESETPTTTPSKYYQMLDVQKFEFPCEEDFKLTTKNGMTVNITSHSLVDAKGSPITGKIQLDITEYYTAAEIILGGITMNYNDGNQTYNFESDGMFTINATQNGKEVFVQKGKTINIETVRKSKKDGYQFFGLEKEKWVKDENNILENDQTKAIKVIERPTSPHIPTPLIKFNPNYYTIESDQRKYLPKESLPTNDFSNTVLQIELDVNENPWLLNKKEWKFDSKTAQILRNKEVVKNKMTYDTISYRTLYAVRGNKKYEEYLKLEKDYNIALTAYEANYAERQKNGQLTTSEKQLIVLSQFGTYNIDRYLNYPKQLVVEKSFKLSIPEKLDANTKIFLVAKGNDGKIYPVDLTVYKNEIRFKKNEENALIALTTNKAYGLNSVKFKYIAKQQINTEAFNFELEEINFSNADGLNKTIESLF